MHILMLMRVCAPPPRNMIHNTYYIRSRHAQVHIAQEELPSVSSLFIHSYFVSEELCTRSSVYYELAVWVATAEDSLNWSYAWISLVKVGSKVN